MSILTYLFIGTVLMFCFEYYLNTDSYKYQMKKLGKDPIFKIETKERIIGFLFWPLFVVVFLYNFFNALNK